MENPFQKSAETLVSDVLAIIHQLRGAGSPRSSCRLVLVGHSLGGAVAIRLASHPRLEELAQLEALVVVDMVEGRALESFEFMSKALQDIPRRFDTMEAAIQWTISSGIIKNIDSARLSVPAQLVPVSQLICFAEK